MSKPITKNLYDWCKDNNRNDLLDRWDYDKNDKTPFDVGFNSKQIIYFKCENNIHDSETHCLNSSSKNHNCKRCGSFEQWCKTNNHEVYLKNWNYDLNKINPENARANSNKKYYFYCNNNREHKGYYISLNNITNSACSMNDCLECNSLEKWCIDNNRNDIIERWDNELNTIRPNEIHKNKNIKIYLKCPISIHKSEKYNLQNITGSRNIEKSGTCRKCNSFAQHLIDLYGESALDKYWDYNKNTYSPWEISKSARKKVWIKCQEKDYHGSYEVLCVSFTSKGCRCTYCNDTMTVHKLDSVGCVYPFVKEYWNGDINDLYSIAPHSNTKYDFICHKHGAFTRTMNDVINSICACPICSRERNESIIQENVRNYILNNYEYNLNHERKCSIIPINPKTKWGMPFDNEITNIRLIIEVHGIQHYEVCGFHLLQSKHNSTTPEEEFEYQQWKDKYKKDFALSKGYYYLEIPYWTDKDESYKKLIDEKIIEIQSTESQQDSLLLCSNL